MDTDFNRISNSKNKVELVSITPNAESIIVFCARVSNPSNQTNFTTSSKLLEYCIKQGHWSIFEQASMNLQIITSRAISAQILRHRSFSFQEFSQRYSKAQEFEQYKARRQDLKNRQNSIDDLDHDTILWFEWAQLQVNDRCQDLYNTALEKGIAKEQARFLLPLSTKTRLYMNGSIRSWTHYITLRTNSDTQLEHRVIAEQCKSIFITQLPEVSKALNWI